MKVREALEVNGCVAAAYDGVSWMFPCGLAIVEDLALSEIADDEAIAAREAHQRHHDEGHTMRPYGITVRPYPNGIEARCTC